MQIAQKRNIDKKMYCFFFVLDYTESNWLLIDGGDNA